MQVVDMVRLREMRAGHFRRCEPTAFGVQFPVRSSLLTSFIICLSRLGTTKRYIHTYIYITCVGHHPGMVCGELCRRRGVVGVGL